MKKKKGMAMTMVIIAVVAIAIVAVAFLFLFKAPAGITTSNQASDTISSIGSSIDGVTSSLNTIDSWLGR